MLLPLPTLLVLPRERGRVSALAVGARLPLRDPQGRQRPPRWRGDRTSQLPMHGKGKELGRGLVEKIKKDLGLKQRSYAKGTIGWPSTTPRC
jgi:hypothetical protein